MNKSFAVLFAFLGITMTACATKTATPVAAASNTTVASAELPEIAPYDDPPIEMLPEVMPVVEEVAP